MLKHVQVSPLRNRSDSVSWSSIASRTSSICGSPEPIHTDTLRSFSRTSSYSSLSEQMPQTIIKVYTNYLKIDIEYKSLGIQWDTTSKEVILQLLKRLKMGHRDPRLFYLSMEVFVSHSYAKTILILDDETRPALLQACHPKGESRFHLEVKQGGLIRVHTSTLQSNLQYKSLVISEETTADEVLALILASANHVGPIEKFSLYEVCPGMEYQRKLHPDDIPLRVQSKRTNNGESCHFIVRRNSSYVRRCLLSSMKCHINSKELSQNCDQNFEDSKEYNNSNFSQCVNLYNDNFKSFNQAKKANMQETPRISSKNSTNLSELFLNIALTDNNSKEDSSADDKDSSKWSNKQELCKFNYLGNANHSSDIFSAQNRKVQIQTPQTYNPVYDIREIRTVSHSFSSLGKDKKLLDIEKLIQSDSSKLYRQSQYNCDVFSCNTNNDIKSFLSSTKSSSNEYKLKTLDTEMVKNNPSRGLGHFVYI